MWINSTQSAQTSIIILTELTSNTATASTFIPIFGATALGLGQDPLLLIIPATLGASCAFMMPVATPPNTIAYASGHLKISDMMKTGIWLNIFSIIVLSILIYLFLPIIWDFTNFQFIK